MVWERREKESILSLSGRWPHSAQDFWRNPSWLMTKYGKKRREGFQFPGVIEHSYMVDGEFHAYCFGEAVRI